jgi:hypothetical protein
VDYAFKNIESLIRNAIRSGQKIKMPLHEQFTKIRKAVGEEKSKAENLFAMQAVAFESSDQVARYIHYHQGRLINFIDELFAVATTSNKPKAGVVSETLLFLDQVECILQLIKREFEPFFSLDMKFPDSQRAAKLKGFANQYKNVQDRLSSLGVSPNLKTIVLDLIRETMTTTAVTYRRVGFTEQLINDVLDLNEGLPLTETENDIRIIAITLNLNSPVFFKIYTNTIKAECGLLDSDFDKLQRLALHLKDVSQCYPRRWMAYEIDLPSIKDQVSNWLLEEMQFLHSKEPQVVQSQARDQFGGDFKLEFDMSVSQFAFFTKALVESGVIQNKNISELIRFLSKFVKTKKSGSISQESLRIKYYDVESSTKEAVKNTLHTAIGYINSH